MKYIKKGYANCGKHMKQPYYRSLFSDMNMGHWQPCGEDCSLHKLTTQEVLEIRELYAKGDVSMKKLGERFKIGKTEIYRIVHKIWWKHV